MKNFFTIMPIPKFYGKYNELMVWQWQEYWEAGNMLCASG